MNDHDADADDPDSITTIHHVPEAVLIHIFSFLGPKTLFTAGLVSKSWVNVSRDGNLWKTWYTDRWACSGRTSIDIAGDKTAQCWFKQFSRKMERLDSWTGRYALDALYGHKQGVRSCKLLPGFNLLATGSLDKTVRLWDLASGVSVSSSKPHGGTVRCVALDQDILVSGAADKTMRAWFSSKSDNQPSSATVPLFDLSRPHLDIKGHTGPLTSLCLTDHALYSGSWDCTVRTYSRLTPGHLQLAGEYTYNDWVLSVAARGNHLLVAAGSEVLCHDQGTGKVVRKFQDLHQSNVQGVEGTQNSHLLFTAAGEGLVMAHDLRMKRSSRIIWHHNAGVLGLVFEDPWLSSACSDGTIVLMNTETQMKGGVGSLRALSTTCRQLHTPAGPAYCVDMVDQRIACGSESEIVRVWDFTRAQGMAHRAAAAKEGHKARKGSQRMGRSSLQHRAAASQALVLLGTSPPTPPPILEGLEVRRAACSRRSGGQGSEPHTSQAGRRERKGP